MNRPKKSVHHHISRNQRGVTIIMVALMLFVLVGVAALAVDLSLFYVAKNELQNAADAGALAGARVLYNEDGTAVNTGANQVAYDSATSNKSWKVPVDINWPGNDIQRGHWSFGLGDLARGFYPNEAVTAPPVLWDVSTEELDADTDFINAVRVVARRQATPIVAFFSRIFGYENYQLSADAVAYIGFAGTLNPEEVDQPIAICKESILLNGVYSCNIGRMINSGGNVESHETGGWTDFNQDNPCGGGTNAVAVRELVCESGNTTSLVLGKDMATSGGEIQSAFKDLYDCWVEKTGKIELWKLTLPVIDCPGNNITTCQALQGAVTVNIVWINNQTDPHYNNAPTEMDGWTVPGNTGEERWNNFVIHFNLQNVDGAPAPYDQKSIYFLPDCNPHEPAGTSGGENFGILAKIPVLVE
jgi:hypothetical protein